MYTLYQQTISCIVTKLTDSHTMAKVHVIGILKLVVTSDKTNPLINFRVVTKGKRFDATKRDTIALSS